MQSRIAYPPLQSESVNQAFVEVVLGRPSAKCKHFGICKIERVFANSLSSDKPSFCKSSNKVFGLASFVKGLFFELAFERSAISDSIYKEHFGDGMFRIEEDYWIESDLMGTPIFLSKGEYKNKLSDTLLSVRINL